MISEELILFFWHAQLILASVSQQSQGHLEPHPTCQKRALRFAIDCQIVTDAGVADTAVGYREVGLACALAGDLVVDRDRADGFLGRDAGGIPVPQKPQPRPVGDQPGGYRATETGPPESSDLVGQDAPVID